MELRNWEFLENNGDVFAPRTGHTLVADESHIYLFGGTDGVTRKNDIYRYQVASGIWQGLVPDGPAPSARSGSQAVLEDENIYFFGGYTKKNGEYFNDLFKFTIPTCSWSQLEVTGPLPEKRTDHSLCIFKGNLYLFGGSDGNSRLSDTWMFSIETSSWSLLPCNNSPEPRFGHTAVMYKDKMLVLGGWNGHNTLNDVWTFSCSTRQWNKALTTGFIFPRYRHSAVIYGSSILIFGGVNKEQLRFDDLVTFNVNRSHFTKIPIKGAVPSARTFHKACIVGNFMFVVGGYDGSRKNDMFRISLQEDSPEDDLETNPLAEMNQIEEDLLAWKGIKFMGKPYSARTGHTAVLINTKIYVFGGTDETTRRNDLYCYDISNNLWNQVETSGMVPTPRSGAKSVTCGQSFYLFGGYTRKDGTYYNDLYRFDTSSNSWNKLFCSGEIPSIRTDHTAVLYENAIYIFGGYDGKTRFNDLRFCRLENYEWKSVPNSSGLQPLPRFGHSAVVFNDSMYVFGGWDGHETLDDLYQYNFTTGYWYELKRTVGSRPSQRYRHSCVVFSGSLFIFGGVDKSQRRFNDLHEYNIQHKEWTPKRVEGEIPSHRTFHTALVHDNVMFILGGFDGKRQNDLFSIKLQCEDLDIFSRTSSSISSLFDLDDQIGDDFQQEMSKSNFLLKQQEKELRKRLDKEQKRSFCKNCRVRPVNTVILDCAHFFLCEDCAKDLKLCSHCNKEVSRIVVTFTPY